MSTRRRDDLTALFPPLPSPRKFKTAPCMPRVMPARAPQVPQPRELRVPLPKVGKISKLKAKHPPKR